MGMNLSNFLGYAGMESHDLMKYAFCLVYVFDILLLRQCLQSLPESRVFSGCAAVSLALIAAVIWGSVQTANALYLKKDLERQATLSRMTELCLRLDQTEGYVPGETPVVFIGLPSFDTPEALGSVSQITGAGLNSTVGGGYYAAYFSYILQTPIRIGSETALPEGTPIDAMPPFPAEGSICRAGDTLIVRMG